MHMFDADDIARLAAAPRVRTIYEQDLDALLQAGAALAQTVSDLAGDTLDAGRGDPEDEAAAAALRAEWEAWEAAYARVEGGAE
jgi:uncharacterized protein related to proFAR isomerase